MKKILAILLVAAMTATAAGCSGDNNVSVEDSEVSTSTPADDNGEDNNTSSEADSDSEDTTSDDENNDAAQLEAADKIGGIGDILYTEFFSMKVADAYKLSSVSGYIPNDENYDYVCIDVIVTNTFDETINVGTYDFDIVWGDTENDIDYAIEQDDFGYDKYPASVDLKRFEHANGNVFFMVPKDAEELRFQYKAIYEDNSTGDIYQIILKDLEYRDDPSEAPVTTAAFGETMSTSVFDMTVNGVRTLEMLGDYTADEGYKFIGVDVTMTGTSAEAVETGAYYFSVYWGDGEDDICYAIEDETVADFPVTVELAEGDTASGEMFFIVPTETEYIDFYYFDIYDETLADFIVTLGASADIA